MRRYAGRELFRCPARHLQLEAPWVWSYLQLFKPWRDGRPIAADIFLDEPAILVDAMRVIENEINDLERSEQENQGAGDGGHRSRYAPAPSTGPNAPPRGRR